MTLAAGTRLGNNEIVRVLGGGGMGEVYLARRTARPRDRPEVRDAGDGTRSDTRKRFLREARLAIGLPHPSVAVIYEVGEWEDQLFLAMEYVPGETLSQRLKPGPLRATSSSPLPGK